MPTDTPPGAGDTPAAWWPDPARIEGANLTNFIRAQGLADFDALRSKADADPGWYWDAVIRYCDLQFYTPYERILDTSEGPAWAKWCAGGTTNIVLNCLDRHRDTPTMDKPAVVWEGESGEVREWSYTRLDTEVCRLAEGLRGLGLGRGDVVGIYMPMLPETMAAFLAVAKIGGIVLPLFTGFGPEAIASRLNDGRAVAVLTADGTRRRGKTVRLKDTLDRAAEQVPSLRLVVVYETLELEMQWYPGRDHRWQMLIDGAPNSSATEAMPADETFMIIFTSGTTGSAKGTVHTHCGFSAKMAGDLLVFFDLRPEDRFMWMSDMGWLVGPAQVVAPLLQGATVVLAEGTPDYPVPGRLWRTVNDRGVTYLGVAPTVARGLMQVAADPRDYDLSSLRVVVSSGELWTPDAWNWFFDTVCRRRVPILNISGGTEIGWAIVGNTVIHPHKPCAFSTSLPGMAADVVNANGESLPPGHMGELVLRQPSIGLSRGLWRDPERYLDTYWNKIPGMWAHGDWASRDNDGHWYLHGRSDDTIMVAGKRCGPAEVEAIIMQTGLVLEAAASAMTDAIKGESVLCVCVPREDIEDASAVSERLRQAVVEVLGAAFRPGDVVFVSQLPKTRSMKVMRRVVRWTYEGRDPGDLSSLVNPEAVEELRQAVARRGEAGDTR